MVRVVKRSAAARDLLLQWAWYSENAGDDRFLAAVDQTLESLSRQPGIGTQVFFRKSRLKGMRRFPVSGGFEKFMLFYLILDDGIELVRVAHGSRNLIRLGAGGFFS